MVTFWGVNVTEPHRGFSENWLAGKRDLVVGAPNKPQMEVPCSSKLSPIHLQWPASFCRLSLRSVSGGQFVNQHSHVEKFQVPMTALSNAKGRPMRILQGGKDTRMIT